MMLDSSAHRVDDVICISRHGSGMTPETRGGQIVLAALRVEKNPLYLFWLPSIVVMMQAHLFQPVFAATERTANCKPDACGGFRDCS